MFKWNKENRNKEEELKNRLDDDDNLKLKRDLEYMIKMTAKMQTSTRPIFKFKVGNIIVVRVDAFASVPCGLITKITNIYPESVMPCYYIKTLNPNRVAPMIVEESEIRIANDREQFLYHMHGPCVLDEVNK